MRVVYVLKMTRAQGGGILWLADDPERLNMAMSQFTAVEQSRMIIEEHDVLEDGD